LSKLLKTIMKMDIVIKMLYHVLFNFIGFLPVKKKLIIFESFLGKQYSCNPRAIYEYLKDNHPEFTLLWSVDRKHQQRFKELEIPYINRLSIKWLFLMPRAEFWVNNSRMPDWLQKPWHTTYLQTWHGTPLKKLAADIEEIHMPGTTTDIYKESFYKEAKNWDFLVSPNLYSSAVFKGAFHYSNKILETGYPRNDFLFNNNNSEHVSQIKKALRIPNDKKVILYAPTWRDDEYFSKWNYKFSLNIDLEKLRSSFGKDTIILLRLHYLIANKLDVSLYNGFVLDVTNHDDIRELYIISDLLITDYSSVFFDYLCLKRPIIFYVYDIDSYRDKLRGFYFDFEKDAPGPLVKTNEELIETIKKFDLGEWQSESINRFHNKFCYLEKGLSTERVVKSVFVEREVK
jgi:CDP-glycerol glycerophosphotransferase